MTDHNSSLDYQRVEKAIRYIGECFREQPTLDDLADHLGMSPYHVQRLFKRWAGVSPKRFLQYVTLEHAKRLLQESDTVLEASYGSGLSGPSRLHDLFVTIEAVTPGQYRSEGQGIELRWGVHPTPFGQAFFAVTERGLTSLAFVPEDGPISLVDSLRQSWPKAVVQEAPRATRSVARRIFGSAEHATSLSSSPVIRSATDSTPQLRLHVHGTNFQVRVWEALLRIPPAAAVTYGHIARILGERGAARAVGQAVGRNPIAVIIPCHRVIRRSEGFGGYRWGETRKKALLGWESSARWEATDHAENSS